VSDIPNETEHMAWFALRRADPGCVLNMVNHGDTRSGIVRLDRRTDPDGFEVSIVTAPEKRGIGIARAALALVRELLPETRLLAYISSANEASLSLFAASGYRPLGEDWYENRPAGDAPRT
jgi:RimJ/RimL family protein N-acetyltransferase